MRSQCAQILAEAVTPGAHRFRAIQTISATGYSLYLTDPPTSDVFLLIPRTYGNVPISKLLLINEFTVKKSGFLVFTILGRQSQTCNTIGPWKIGQPWYNHGCKNHLLIGSLELPTQYCEYGKNQV